MGWILAIPVVLAGLALAAHLWAGWRFRRRAARLAARVAQGRAADAPRDDLPGPVAAIAARGICGAKLRARAVHLVQAAELELGPGRGWQPLAARQAIGVAVPGFVWEAWQARGPLTTLRVVDSYVDGCGMLEARAMGSIPVARVEGGEMDRGEAMRYLAELPWAPDAILANRMLDWRVLESGEIEARLAMAPRDAVVRFRLGAAGDIVEMNAADRPATGPDGRTELRAWRGRFFDYGEIGGRRIPLGGEVGYVVDGEFRPYWRGRVTGYALG